MTETKRAKQSKWRAEPLPDTAWKPAPDLARSARAAEQDDAASGRVNRLIRLSEGRTAAASVYLRLPTKSRRIYAYLRWSDHGRTNEQYICEVTGQSRLENLTQAWRSVVEQGLNRVDVVEATGSWASSDAVRNVMRANRSRDTRPELALRRAVHALGLRYRVGRRPEATIRRTADLVFSGPKVAVFVDGCFWHGCPEHYRPATKNNEFWSDKIGGNRIRDADTDEKLRAAGWTVVRVWEHEDPSVAASHIAEVVMAGVIQPPE